jgi:nucleotide-binding universal stress UspA family protein
MRILVAVDGSDPAHRAVDLGARLSRQLEAKLKIFSVGNSTDFTWDHQTDDYARWKDRTVGERIQAICEERLKIARQRAEACGISDIQWEWQTGDPTKSIVDAARRDETDIIIVGKRGRGQL